MTVPVTRVEVTPPQSYDFGTGTPAGVWLGLGPARVTVLASGLLLAVGTLSVHAPAPFALIPLLAAAGLVGVPVAGRTASGWTGPAIGHLTGLGTGRLRWHRPLTDAGSTLQPDTVASLPGRLRLPGEYGRLTLGECPGEWPVGHLTDRRAGTVTVVFDIVGVDRFPLLDPADQDRLLTDWGATLTALTGSGTGVLRAQLVDRVCGAAPSDRMGERDPETAELDAAVRSLSAERDSLLAVQFRGTPGVDVAAGLPGRCRSVAAVLLGAQLAARPLPAAEVAAVLTRLFDPTRRSADADANAVCGPLSRRSRWDHVRTDDTVHRCFAVTGWPASPVGASWFAPLLLAVPAAAARTVAVHLETVPTAVAARIARTARTRSALDQADRRRLGLASSSATDRAAEASVGLDDELAAGHAAHRVTAVIAVSASSVPELDAASAELRDVTALSRLFVAPLHGQHDRALAGVLPLCRLRSGGAR